MKNKFLLVGILSLVGAAGASAAESGAALEGSSQGEVVSTDVAPAVKHWKASASNYYYSFEGTQAAQDNLYNFGKTTLWMQLVSLQYSTSPTGWTFLALGQRLDNYVETNFPLPTGNILYQDRTIGWGDVLVDAIHPIYLGSSFLLFGDIGLSIPTGSINKKNPSNANRTNYAYNMQMGSGTYDAELGTVGLYLHRYFQAGTHLSTYQRLGSENANGYKLGNLYKGEGWVDVPVGYGFTPRVVGYYKVKQAIKGVDPTLGRNAYTEYYHHDQQNWDVSAALKFERPIVGTATITAEAGVPFAQGSKNSDQVVVSTNYYGTVGVSGTF